MQETAGTIAEICGGALPTDGWRVAGCRFLAAGLTGGYSNGAISEGVGEGVDVQRPLYSARSSSQVSPTSSCPKAAKGSLAISR